MNREAGGLCLQWPVLLSWSAAVLQTYFWLFHGSSFVITSNSSLSWQKAFEQLWVWKNPASERWLQSLLVFYVFFPLLGLDVGFFLLLLLVFLSICLICISKIINIKKNTVYKLTKTLILPAEIAIHTAEILQRLSNFIVAGKKKPQQNKRKKKQGRQ